MKIPKMILFDYGQTLVSETTFDGFAGMRALQPMLHNPSHVSEEEIQKLANQLNQELNRVGPESCKNIFEIQNSSFWRYLYEYFSISLLGNYQEAEELFWDHASPGEATPHIAQLLQYLHSHQIRTGVISNITFSGESLSRRIAKCIPDHHFEMMIASSDYLFRKPHPRIFQLALRKANLFAQDVWYCGDHGICDIDGARNAGLFPIWYRGALGSDSLPPTSADTSFLCIDHWDKLIEILENCTASF